MEGYSDKDVASRIAGALQKAKNAEVFLSLSLSLSLSVCGCKYIYLHISTKK